MALSIAVTTALIKLVISTVLASYVHSLAYIAGQATCPYSTSTTLQTSLALLPLLLVIRAST
jgi:hypothetical protein